ncbi:MAG: ABC transporter permease [Clostridia bacterium]|nr:ABC transporter permease [Clostridia bacterium]
MNLIVPFLTEAIRYGMTFLFGSTGETLTEKSGHLNLGIPGIMSVGAACGCTAIYLCGRKAPAVLIVILAILAAFVGAALVGLIYSFFTVSLRANQNVTGLVLTTFGVGVTNYMISKVGSFSFAAKHFTTLFPFAKKLGWFGELFFSYGILVYLAIAIALVSAFVLSRTRVGLHLRAVGENPATADAAGINVAAYRYVATCVGSGIAGIGGLCYIMDNLHGCWEYAIEAIGWLAIALVIFTVWKPNVAIFGSIVFGALYNVSSYIPNLEFYERDLVKMLPYVVTILVLIISSVRKKRENQPPASLGLSYFREER